MIEITGKFKESIPVIAPKIAVKEKVLSPNIAVFLDPSRRCFFSLTSLSSPITAPIKNAKINLNTKLKSILKSYQNIESFGGQICKNAGF